MLLRLGLLFATFRYSPALVNGLQDQFTTLVPVSRTVLHLFKPPGSQTRCVLQMISPSSYVTDSDTGSIQGTFKRDLLSSIFHDNFIPIVNPPTRFRNRSYEPDEAIVLANQLHERVKDTVTSYTRYTQCVSTVLAVPPAVSDANFLETIRGQYMRQFDKVFFIGEEETLRRVLQMVRVQRLRWPIGIIVKSTYQSVPLPLTNSRASIEQRTFSSLAEVLIPHDHKLTRFNTRNLPPGFGLRLSLNGVYFSAASSSLAASLGGQTKKRDKGIGVPMSSLFYASQFYNFSYSLVTIQFSANTKFPNGTWPMKLQKLVTYDFDVLLGAYAYVQRDEIASFSQAIDFAGICFFTSHPRMHSQGQALLFPFDTKVWLSITITFIGLVLSFFLALLTSNSPKLRSMSLSARMAQAFCMAYVILLEQSFQHPILQGSRGLSFLVTLGLMVFLVTETAYSSDLVSYLTQPLFSPIPQTYSDLASRKEFRILFMHNNGWDVEFFQTTTLPVYQDINNRYEKVAQASKCLIEAANVSKTACMIHEPAGVVEIAKNLTAMKVGLPLRKSKEAVLISPIVMAYPKFHKFSFELNRVFNGLIDTGHYEIWKTESMENLKIKGRQWIREPGNRHVYELVMSSIKTKPLFQPFSFRSIESIFWLFMAGVQVGSIAFAVERWFSA